MPDLDAPLDRSIRELVARAVADAPAAPTIDEHTVRDGRPDPADRHRWIVGGLAGLSIAAALVALVLWARPDDLTEQPLVPATDPPTVPTVTAVPAPTPTSTLVNVPVTAPPTGVGDSSEPTNPPTTATIAPVVGVADGRVVRAGPDGVTAVWFDGSGGELADLVTGEPMAVAFAVPDGRVFMQRSDDSRDPDADTTLLVATAPHEVGPLDVPAELVGVPLRLHDAAEVGGEVVLLVESGPGRCAGFDDCDGSLWAFHPDSGAIDGILTRSMWEEGFGHLHLTETGLIVGEQFAEVLSMPFFGVVPGSAATPLELSALGLDAEYADCSTCPTAFAVDRAGATIAWLERDTDADGVIQQAVIVLTSVDGTARDRVPLIDDRGEPTAELVPFSWLELVSATPGTPRTMIVNSTATPVADPVAPASIDLDTGVVTSTGLAPGTVVTAG